MVSPEMVKVHETGMERCPYYSPSDGPVKGKSRDLPSKPPTVPAAF